MPGRGDEAVVAAFPCRPALCCHPRAKGKPSLSRAEGSGGSLHVTVWSACRPWKDYRPGEESSKRLSTGIW